MTGMSECLSVILRAGMGRVSSSLPPLRPGEQRERRGDGPLLDGEELEATELCLSMPGPVLNEPGRGVVVSREGGEEEDRRRVVVWRQVDGPHGGRRAGSGCTVHSPARSGVAGLAGSRSGREGREGPRTASARRLVSLSRVNDCDKDQLGTARATHKTRHHQHTLQPRTHTSSSPTLSPSASSAPPHSPTAAAPACSPAPSAPPPSRGPSPGLSPQPPLSPSPLAALSRPPSPPATRRAVVASLLRPRATTAAAVQVGPSATSSAAAQSASRARSSRRTASTSPPSQRRASSTPSSAASKRRGA